MLSGVRHKGVDNMRTEYILKNGMLIDEIGNISEGRDLWISEGKIKEIGEIKQEGVDVVDCSGMYITPGLVNLHVHSPMSIFKGIAEDVTIEDWFNKEIFPYESQLQPEDVYWGTLLAMAEMVNNGVTAFADHYFFADTIAKAAEKVGIRADIAITIFGMSETFEEDLKAAVDMIRSKRGESDCVKLRLGPHAPYTSSVERLQQVAKAAKDLDVGVHIHVSETKEQVEQSKAVYGKTPFEVLHDSGMLDVPTIVGHGLWVERDDLKYTTKDMYFAACQKTYFKLSMGDGNLSQFFKQLPIAFGTDGAASSNTLSPLEQARLFALQGKYESDQPEAYTLKEIWSALMRGHEALGFHSGKLAEGYAADLVVWDLQKVNTAPVYKPLASILYSADSSNVYHTIVKGNFIKEDGVLQLNTNEILTQVREIQDRIVLRGKAKAKVNY